MPIPAGPPPVAAPASAWVERTRSHLMTGRNEERNTLAAAYGAGSGTLVFNSTLGGITAGIRLSIGLNTFHVISTTQASLTATVVGGQEGTTDADAPSDSLVRVAPRFTDAEILNALGDEIADLSSPLNGLFQVIYVDLAYVTNTIPYTLPDGLIDIYDVRVRTSLTDIYGWTRLDRNQWSLDRAGDVGSPVIQVLYPVASTGSTLRVLYRAGFSAPLTLAESQATSGLPASAYDIPPLGAAMRLVATREVKRNFTESQGDTRRATEVPANAVAGSMRPLAALRASRVQAEAARLVAQYPDRRR